MQGSTSRVPKVATCEKKYLTCLNKQRSHCLSFKQEVLSRRHFSLKNSMNHSIIHTETMNEGA